jgi:hypothetical protein
LPEIAQIVRLAIVFSVASVAGDPSASEKYTNGKIGSRIDGEIFVRVPHDRLRWSDQTGTDQATEF